MKLLPALASALGLACSAPPCPAAAGPLAELQEAARAARLAEDPAWADLLHYASPPLGGRPRSLADDASFFNAPDGAHELAAELDATLARLAEPARPTAPDEHPQCRFPARLAWLQEKLAGVAAALPRQPCPRFEAWIAEINPAGATLVFPSAYVNSPASMFGHTLLRIDAAGQTEATRLLAYTINYAARADSADGLSFALKGLFGAYPGTLSSSPYYLKVREYSDMESRDVWEYQLDLSTAETRQLLRHAWEIGATRFDYWFFDENCSYMILRLLDVARPGLGISRRFRWTAIPVDTVKSITAVPGLVTEVRFRPSAGSELAHRATRLPPETMAAAIAVAEGRRTPESLGTDREAIAALEFTDRLVSLRGHAGQLGADEALARLKSIQTTRSRLPTLASDTPAEPPRPEGGHGSGRASLAAGRIGNQAALFLGVRPAYHELLDPESGYSRGAQIRFGDFAASQRAGQAWRIARFLPVDIVSVAPQRPWSQPLSWKVRFGWEQGLGSRHAASPLLAGGPGLAAEWRSLLGYVFLENQFLASGALKGGWSVGSGPLAGLLWDFDSASRLQLEASRQWFTDDLQRSAARARWRRSLGPRDNLVGSYEWLRTALPAGVEGERRLALGWEHYF